MTCERCGATLEDGAFCKRCGARVLRPKDVGADSDNRTAPERFELAEKAAAHAEGLGERRAADSAVAGAFAVAFLIGDAHTPVWFRMAFVVVALLMIIIVKLRETQEDSNANADDNVRPWARDTQRTTSKCCPGSEQ